jgi:hypothetical protein
MELRAANSGLPQFYSVTAGPIRVLRLHYARFSLHHAEQCPDHYFERRQPGLDLGCHERDRAAGAQTARLR